MTQQASSIPRSALSSSSDSTDCYPALLRVIQNEGAGADAIVSPLAAAAASHPGTILEDDELTSSSSFRAAIAASSGGVRPQRARTVSAADYLNNDVVGSIYAGMSFGEQPAEVYHHIHGRSTDQVAEERLEYQQRVRRVSASSGSNCQLDLYPCLMRFVENTGSEAQRRAMHTAAVVTSAPGSGASPAA
ncbi:hypothetical protein GQ42DRAFT_176961 [Ramicandelaber brevisporus]|nr:hypothetical protein GQ42DRAFT_176961 [Ramicandelaber brevisporus]